MKNGLTTIQKEIMRILWNKQSSYATPVNSQEIGKLLNITPSYIREQAKRLEKMGYISVRRGPGGGYFSSIQRAMGN